RLFSSDHKKGMQATAGRNDACEQNERGAEPPLAAAKIGGMHRRSNIVQPLAIIRARIGLRMNRAIATTTMFMMAVSRNTRCQLPVEVLMMLATGTRNAEVPFAV